MCRFGIVVRRGLVLKSYVGCISRKIVSWNVGRAWDRGLFIVEEM